MKAIGIVVVAALTIGCRVQTPPIPVRGEPTEISKLAGSWVGDYSSIETGRSGNILFTLQAGRDTAYGDVLMVPRSGPPVMAAERPIEHMTHAASMQALRISFVAVSGGEVSGRIEPYIAPDCECEVTTSFRGKINGDVIIGTYVTRGGGIVQEGRWTVSRDRPSVR